jgi:hypothetical protein
MEWRVCREFPDPKSHDWREPFAVAFDVYWGMPYAEFHPFGIELDD